MQPDSAMVAAEVMQARYTASLLEPYAERLVYGFTGKPFSLGGPDTPTNPVALVRENRKRFLAAYQLSHLAWTTVEQVHGHRIGRSGDSQFKQTDGIVLTHPHQPALLLFADCVPVMLYDPEQHAGAVLHAGWRGTRQLIVREGVMALQNAVGSQPENLLAVIGPAISGCCFQVSRSVAEELAQAMETDLNGLETQGQLMWDADFPDNPRVDLKAINRMQLERMSVSRIESLSHCTHCQPEQLFSYRRGENGRNGAYMMLLP